MKLTVALLSLVSLGVASSLPPAQHVFANAPDYHPSYKIPTVHKSAVQARRILHLEKLGTLSTIFPAEKGHPHERRPEEVSGTPIGLMDYFADCESDSGNPTILAFSIGTAFRNEAAGSNISLSVRWHMPTDRPYSAAAVPRFSLIGYLEDISDKDVEEKDIAACYVAYHPDAAGWLPGSNVHRARWARLVVQDIYWVGGFGDRAYIGWIPVEEWQSVTQEEIASIRLPGEKSHGKAKGLWKSLMGYHHTEKA